MGLREFAAREREQLARDARSLADRPDDPELRVMVACRLETLGRLERALARAEGPPPYVAASPPPQAPSAAEYLSPAGAAAYLSVTRRMLESWRAKSVGPAFAKLGRHVRYRRSDIDAWVAAKRFAPPTSSAEEEGP